MSQMKGADVGELYRLSGQLKQQASNLRAIRNGLSGPINNMNWHGPDAAQFRKDWAQNHRRAIDDAAGMLEALATVLSKNAKAQEDTSNEYAATGWTAPIDNLITDAKIWLNNLKSPVVNGKMPAETDSGDTSGDGSSGGTTSGGSTFNLEQASADWAQGSRQRNNFTADYFHSGEGKGQCTAWVNYRRKQLGLDSPTNWRENHTIFYPGQTTNNPTPGAVGSSPGHTFIVESIDSSTHPRKILISEMNWAEPYDREKNPYLTPNTNVLTTATLEEVSPGIWRRTNGTQYSVSFGA